MEQWPLLQRAIPGLFSALSVPPSPALLHGDLWSGNVAFVYDDQGAPCPGDDSIDSDVTLKKRSRFITLFLN